MESFHSAISNKLTGIIDDLGVIAEVIASGSFKSKFAATETETSVFLQNYTKCIYLMVQ